MAQQNIVKTLGPLAAKYGMWVVLGLMAVEIFIAHRRGDL